MKGSVHHLRLSGGGTGVSEGGKWVKTETFYWVIDRRSDLVDCIFGEAFVGETSRKEGTS